MQLQHTIAKQRTAFSAALLRVKRLVMDKKPEQIPPTCFISYAWGVTEHERWVKQLARDLQDAGINALLDLWDSQPGSNLDRFIERIHQTEFVLVIGSPALLKKYRTKDTNPVVSAELDLINYRVRQKTKFSESVLPLLLDEEADKSFPPQLLGLVSVDFRQNEWYFRQLFLMIWQLFELPPDHLLLDDLLESMSPDADSKYHWKKQ